MNIKIIFSHSFEKKINNEKTISCHKHDALKKKICQNYYYFFFREQFSHFQGDFDFIVNQG